MAPLKRHLLPVLTFPVMMIVVIPTTICLLAGVGTVDTPTGVTLTLATIGGVFLVCGLYFFVWTVLLFDKKGEGTLALFDAPTKLVVAGPYKHVRNPMLSAAIMVIGGEALVLRSPWIGTWFLVFFALNAILIPLFEEPDLRKRFGEEYDVYRREVPRWIPRTRPWSG
ncbi:methyltransferase family protein [Streptomyces litchfieldiae]|uniref:Isoprenylcysteine carboxylmethyltransferase family protein n=1 Tax=Streptomyces litchfieldiae TaxID=3075543 RepID=A0ABU2MZ54_9ACTN|nr:isoprenylcysteine carboxylmethyltransferase family protein [Streptomyces sp. DSM 44938]MDT0346926.1 isoprenylcysteine carboxylmethyltransferase family protein [Streptomyces sp. DSM 44938]